MENKSDSDTKSIDNELELELSYEDENFSDQLHLMSADFLEKLDPFRLKRNNYYLLGCCNIGFLSPIFTPLCL